MRCIACGNNTFLNSAQIVRCVKCGLEKRTKLLSERTIKRIYTKEYFKQTKKLNYGYPDYEALLESHRIYFRAIFYKIARKIPIQASILDIGCGPAVFLQIAKNEGYRVFGVDPVPGISKKVWKKSKIRIVESDFETLQLQKSTYQLITAFQTFEHSRDPEKFLRQTHKALCVYGTMVITTPDTGSMWRALLGSNWFSYKHIEHVFFWNKSSLKSILERTGFTNIYFFSDNWRSYSLREILILFISYTGQFWLRGVYKLVPKRIAAIRVSFPVGSIGVIANKS